MYHSEAGTQVKNMERKSKIQNNHITVQTSVRHLEADQEVEDTDTSNIEANTKYGTMQALKEAVSKIINDIFHKVGDIKN